jgi:hypothetical protein
MARLRAFLLGFREAGGDVGMTYDNDPDSPRSRAYDTGRAWGRRIVWRSADR